MDDNESSNSKYLLASIALHLALILGASIKMVLFPGERPEYIRSVRVDFVALPDKDPNEGEKGVEKPAETPKPETPPTPAEKPKPAPVAEKPMEKKVEPKKAAEPLKTTPTAQDQQSSALKRLEAMNKIKKMKAEKEEGPEGTKYKGNILSEGNALTGVDKLQHDQYISKLDMHIKRMWQLPEWLANKGLTVAVLVRFDENGILLEKRVIKPSGNIEYDNQAVQAITASAPLPPPPENLINYFKQRGIELRFPE